MAIYLDQLSAGELERVVRHLSTRPSSPNCIDCVDYWEAMSALDPFIPFSTLAQESFTRLCISGYAKEEGHVLMPEAPIVLLFKRIERAGTCLECL